MFRNSRSDSPQAPNRKGHRHPQRRILIRSVLFVSAWFTAVGTSGDAYAQFLSQPAARAVEGPRTLNTLERVNYALELAQLGAENGMQDLSLTAVQRALGGGPPISVSESSGPGAIMASPSGLVMTSSQGTVDAGYQNILREIEVRLATLDMLWQQHDFPPDRVYETLRSVVLPENRDGEIFLYARPVLMQQSQQVIAYSEFGAPIGTLEVGSVGRLLAVWAVRAGRVEELRQELAGFESNPRGNRSAAVLLGQLAIAEADTDRLRAHLEELDRYLGQDTTQNSAELACHVALPALAVPEARAAALPLLTRVVDNVTPSITSEGTNIDTLASILRTCSRTYFELGDADEGRRMLDKFLEVHQVNNQRYGGDYPLFLRKQQLGVVAFELLRAGDVEAGLARLGERADIRTLQDYGTVSDAGFAGVLSRGLGRQPPQERFQTLLDFTFPQNRPNHLRIVTEFLPMDAPPAVFAEAAGLADASALRLPATGVGGDLFSTAMLLIETARELDRLDEVLIRLQPLVENDVEFAADLLLLANLADGRTDGVRQRLTALTDEVREAANGENQPPYPMFAHLFAAQAGQQPLAQPASNLFNQLVNFSKKIYNDPLKSHARWGHANTVRNRFRNPSADLLLTCTPEFWDVAGYETATEHAAGTVPNLWFAQQGLINHVCGSRDSNLFFRYPLAGEFEFSVDAQDGGHGEGNICYAGLNVEIQGWGRTTSVYPDGRMRQSERHPMPFIRSGNGVFNRHAVHVSGGVATYYANGYRIYEDRGPRNPWLALHADWGRNPVFANLRLTGNPIIPREVPLLDDEELRGWISSFYGETRPNPVPTVWTASDNRAVPEDSAAAADWDWSFRDGALHGRKLNSSAATALQSRFYYHRPMQNGDVVRYEFFHAPGEVEVYPALGRLAFLLELDGVSLHWMTDGDADVTGLTPRNRVTMSTEQVGSRPLDLRAGAWNDAQLELRDGIARLSLNGAVVCEHVLDPRNDRLFGFFHYKDQTEARVRNAVLTGDWPDQVPPALLADLTSSMRLQRSDSDRHALGALIEERFAAFDAWNVYQRGTRMSPEERYAWLWDWVLKGGSNELIRCYAATTPAHPAEPVAGANQVDVAQLEARLQHQSSRIEVGGNLVAPVLELVSVAGELGRLDELRAQVEGMPLYSVNHIHGRLALLALIALEQGQGEQARASLIELYAQVRKMENFTQHFRWPPVVAASQAVHHQATRDVAIEMMDYIDEQQLHNGQPGDGHFDTHVRFLRGLGWALRDGLAAGQFGASRTGQWTAVPLARASTRGPGHTPVHWRFRPGELLRYAPHEIDCACFAVPLQGDYEVDCRLTSFGWRETRLEAAGLYTAPIYTHESFAIGFKRYRRPDVAIAPRLNALSPWFDYRVVVRGGVYTSFVEGRELHQEQLPDHPDPWLSVTSDNPFAGGVRQLRITGNPQIPEEIPLLSRSDLSNWIFDYYDETVTGDNPDWRVEAQEEGSVLIGRKRPAHAGMNVESIIRYHRPLLEDGEIEFEFRYQPGDVECHPALDRLVFLLREDGVHEHWLTDGMHDRTGLRPDNRSVQPDFRRGPDVLPLNSGEWNKAVLAVAGDNVTLTLNGVLVYERPIAPTNLRVFGLFHYAGETALRARSPVHRGNWPRALPSLEEQELAANPADALVLEEDEAPQFWETDFTGSAYDQNVLRIEGTRLGELIEPSANGLLMRLPAGEQKPSTVGVHPDFGLRGDFQIDAAFEGLQITPPVEAWGAGIEVHVRFADDYDSRIQFERRQFPNQDHSLAPAFHGRFAEGTPRWFKRDFWMSPESGRLRIIRRGEMMSFLFAAEGSDEFELLEEFATHARDVRSVLIRTAASDQVAGTEVLWKSMSIRAREFLDPAEVVDQPLRELDLDLSLEPIGGSRLHVAEPGGDKFARRMADGIELRTPVGQPQPFGVTLASRNCRLSGDFTVTADFELATLTAPRTGYGAGVQLRLSLDDPRQTVLHHCRRAFPDALPAFAAHHVRLDDAGNRLDDSQGVLSELMAGRLRLRREGATVMWEFAPPDSDEFQLFFTAEAGTTDVRAVDLFCESSHPSSGSVDVVWKRLHVVADRILQ